MTAIATERPVYRPLRHPGPRNCWTRPAILAALRAWTDETGRPPRRRDWTGERPESARDAQRKWMREHPRWPSSSAVAARFGSWSAALEAATLPARVMTFPTTVAERVEAARALAADGVGLSEIAERLGVSRASAYNYLRARDCPVCRRPVTSPQAERCLECTRHEPSVPRVWTREEAIAALRDWAYAYGRPPSYRDWTPNRDRPGRWEADSPRWPSASVVAALFDGWNRALRAAELSP